jgi:LPS export ABC transporter protein LptC
MRLFLAPFLVLLIGCSRVPDTATKSDAGAEFPDQVIWEGQIEVVEKGDLQSVVKAGKISLFNKRKVTLLDSGVVVDFYNKAGSHTSRLTADSARVDDMQDLFVAQGNVVVTSDSGATLRTERLYWDRARRKIHSDTLVVLTTEYDSLRGYRFEAEADLTTWQLQQPAGQTFRRKSP